MKLITKILVLMDLSSMDKTLIKFMNSIAERSPVEKIYFVNIIRHFQLPEEVRKEFPELETQAIEDRKSKLKASIEKHFKYADKSDWEVVVRTGSSLRTVSKLSEELDITAVFVGRKNKKEEGVLPQRLARRLACNLVIIPEGSYDQFEDRKSNCLLVPIDFSAHAKTALQQAINFGEYAEKETEILAQNVITVPSGYHYTGKTYKEFANILKKNAEKTYKQYVEDVDFKGIKVTPLFTINKDDKVQTIHRTAKEHNVNAIFFASKGRSGATAYFLGSTAEKLLKIDTKFPLVVVRRKNEFKSIVDSLMEI